MVGSTTVWIVELTSEQRDAVKTALSDHFAPDNTVHMTAKTDSIAVIFPSHWNRDLAVHEVWAAIWKRQCASFLPPNDGAWNPQTISPSQLRVDAHGSESQRADNGPLWLRRRAAT